MCACSRSLFSIWYLCCRLFCTCREAVFVLSDTKNHKSHSAPCDDSYCQRFLFRLVDSLSVLSLQLRQLCLPLHSEVGELSIAHHKSLRTDWMRIRSFYSNELSFQGKVTPPPTSSVVFNEPLRLDSTLSSWFFNCWFFSCNWNKTLK